LKSINDTGTETRNTVLYKEHRVSNQPNLVEIHRSHGQIW